MAMEYVEPQRRQGVLFTSEMEMKNVKQLTWEELGSAPARAAQRSGGEGPEKSRVTPELRRQRQNEAANGTGCGPGERRSRYATPAR